MEDHYCQENRRRESKYLPANLKHFHFVSFKIFNFCLNLFTVSENATHNIVQFFLFKVKL